MEECTDTDLQQRLNKVVIALISATSDVKDCQAGGHSRMAGHVGSLEAGVPRE